MHIIHISQANKTNTIFSILTLFLWILRTGSPDFSSLQCKIIIFCFSCKLFNCIYSFVLNNRGLYRADDVSDDHVSLNVFSLSLFIPLHPLPLPHPPPHLPPSLSDYADLSDAAVRKDWVGWAGAGGVVRVSAVRLESVERICSGNP